MGGAWRLALAGAAASLAAAPSVPVVRRQGVVGGGGKSAGESIHIDHASADTMAYFASLDLGVGPDLGVGLGPDRRTVRVQLDTGSSTLAIPASAATSPSSMPVECHSSRCSGGCGARCGAADVLGSVGQCQPRPMCADPADPLCSDCCTADGACFFSMRYGDGSGIAGGLSTDWVSVGNLGVRYDFGSITSVEGNFEPDQVDGILGIGYAALNCNPSCHPSFVDSLVTINELPDIFALCLGGIDGRASSWEIGEVVQTKYSGTLRWLPVLEASFYVIPRPISLAFGSTAVGGCNPEWLIDTTGVDCGDEAWGQVIVDSGSTEILLNAPLYTAAMRVLSALSPLSETQTCVLFPEGYDPETAFPPLRFDMVDEVGAAFELVISPRQYLLKTRDEDTPAGHTWFCLGIASGTGRTILGDVLMQAYYSVFDRRPTRYSSAGRVGLAPVMECHESQPPTTMDLPPTGVVGPGGLLNFLAARNVDEGVDVAPSAGFVPKLPGAGGDQSCVEVSGVRYCDADDIILGLRTHPERAQGTQHDAVLPTLATVHHDACAGNRSRPATLIGAEDPRQLNFFSDLHYGANMRCEWALQCEQPGQHVSVRVTQLDVEARFDSLRVQGAARAGEVNDSTPTGIVAEWSNATESVALSGHSFDRADRAHEALAFRSASSDGLQLSFRSDGMSSGRGFVLEYSCADGPYPFSHPRTVAANDGWQPVDASAYAAPTPFFFTPEPGVEYTVTARSLGGGEQAAGMPAFAAALVVSEWLPTGKAGQQLASAEDGCDGDPQLVLPASADGSQVLIEVEAVYAASRGRFVLRVDAQQPGCGAAEACRGCQYTESASAPPAPSATSVLLGAVAAVLGCSVCAVLVVLVRRRRQRLLQMELQAAQEEADEETASLLGKKQLGKKPKEWFGSGSDSDGETGSQRPAPTTAARPPTFPAAPVPPIPLDLAPDAKLGLGKTGSTDSLTKLGFPTDSPPATIPSTPSPTMLGHQPPGRASPEQLVLGVVHERATSSLPRTLSMEESDDNESEEESAEGARKK